MYVNMQLFDHWAWGEGGEPRGLQEGYTWYGHELDEGGLKPCKGTSGFIMESAQAPLINTT